ncbi:MAG: hypothetical protein RR505_08265 [Raoultibacter sp.]
MGFRDLTADDIEVRVSTAKATGVSLLLYKDARCDMRILDEAVGADQWQREHYDVKGRMFCRVGILCNGEWVWKSDCGTESNTEAVKGESSDSFKRACFNWGIGRELYTAPFIWIGSDRCKIANNKQGKPACYDKFRVSKISIEDHMIKALEVSSDRGVVYSWGYGAAPAKSAAAEPTTGPSKQARDRLALACRKYAEVNGLDEKSVMTEVVARTDFEKTDECYDRIAVELMDAS